MPFQARAGSVEDVHGFVSPCHPCHHLGHRQRNEARRTSSHTCIVMYAAMSNQNGRQGGGVWAVWVLEAVEGYMATRLAGQASYPFPENLRLGI